MKHYKTIEVPARTERNHVHTTCDLCGEKIASCVHEVDEVVIEHRTGEQYPAGGWGTTISVDMCGKCFDTKLTPWLCLQGASPRSEEWEN